ncbi:MAG: efflux RND transporter permease subunit, partial [Candidatus Melainabacteria bacterium]|nr:efflux RND transporter permease subunit [Candidatus Melainabacteria bacterium]
YYRTPNIRQNTVLLRYDKDQRRDNNQDLDSTYLINSSGKFVPLRSVATIHDRKAPSLIVHDGMRRVVTILGFYRRGGPPSMDLAMEVVQKAIAKVNFPPGYGIEVRGDMTQMSDSFRRLSWGLLLCVMFIYLMLVAQFRGWLLPFQMMLSLPLEMTGVFIGLALMQQTFSSVSVMTVILLTGMHITTAILMIDAIHEYKRQGLPKNDAIRRGCLERIRPILMTNIASILVMVPVSIFPQTGMDAYAPLGTVILWGLFAGTILTLMVIPVTHSLITDLSEWIATTLSQLSRKLSPHLD